MKKYFTPLVFVLLFCSCDRKPHNSFADNVLKNIYELKYRGDSKGLLAYFSNENELYREAAARAFMSLPDTLAIDHLALLLNDKSEKVRSAAAMAMGQQKAKKAESALYKSFFTEKNAGIKNEILTALGKAASDSSLFATLYKSNEREESLQQGFAGMCFYLGIKKLLGAEEINFLTKTINSANHNAAYAASAALSRARNIKLDDYFGVLSNALRSNKDPFFRMNLARALSKVNNDSVVELVHELLNDNEDYRVKINALASLKGYDLHKIGLCLDKALVDKNRHVAIAAANIIAEKADSERAEEYYRQAGVTDDPAVNAKLYFTALKNTCGNFKQQVYNEIVGEYRSSTDRYHKGLLLSALAADSMALPYLAGEMYPVKDRAISTYALNSIIELWNSHKNIKLSKAFFIHLNQALSSGDEGLVAIAADAFRDSIWVEAGLNPDVSLMREAQNKLKMPRDMETFIALQKTIDLYAGIHTTVDYKSSYYLPIDWDFLHKFSEDGMVKIVTDRGEMLVKLYVNEAPATVSAFLKLAVEGYYNGKYFHRVVPNFVVQAGCPRGDGWGNSDFLLRSEISHLKYEEGSLGMASAGKDTEGCQWFITHSPAPHLDGNYTLFGKVVKGLEVLHEIQIGDRIIRMEVLD